MNLYDIFICNIVSMYVKDEYMYFPTNFKIIYKYKRRADDVKLMYKMQKSENAYVKIRVSYNFDNNFYQYNELYDHLSCCLINKELNCLILIYRIVIIDTSRKDIYIYTYIYIQLRSTYSQQQGQSMLILLAQQHSYSCSYCSYN